MGLLVLMYCMYGNAEDCFQKEHVCGYSLQCCSQDCQDGSCA